MLINQYCEQALIIIRLVSLIVCLKCNFFPEAADHYTVKAADESDNISKIKTGAVIKALQAPHIHSIMFA